MKQIYIIFLKLFPAFRFNLSSKKSILLYRESPEASGPLVALSRYSKIDFFDERIFTSIRAIDSVCRLSSSCHCEERSNLRRNSTIKEKELEKLAICFRFCDCFIARNDSMKQKSSDFSKPSIISIKLFSSKRW